jgi:Meiotically up-regulated gene 113
MEDKFLYLIEWNNKHKIGISKDPIKRLKQMTLGPEAKLLYSKEFPHTRKIEKTLHEKFVDKRYSSEWFELTVEDIQYIKDFDIEEYLTYI